MNFGSLLKVTAVVGVAAAGVYYLNKKGKEAITFFKALEVETGQRLERQINLVKRFSAAAGYKMDESDLAVISEAENALSSTTDIRILEPLTVRVSAIMDKIAAKSEEASE